ncbi:proliferating cell nuclear antigen [Atractiella rhizophila]|nr:proliferating cell nuclear antigen [Atractiella rhizophila]
MFEAKLEQADTFKKLLDAIKELVTDANFECSEEGIKLQAMDNSHVALVALELKTEAFHDSYRCDRNLSLGMNLASLVKIVKCAGTDDRITLKAGDDADVLNLEFHNPKNDRWGEYELKLMDIDQEHLGIPDTNYEAEVEMTSTEFRRIMADLKDIGESVKIEVTKEGISFATEGDVGKAAVHLKPTSKVKKNDSDDDDEDEDEDEESEDEDKKKVKKEKGIKKEKEKKSPKKAKDSDEEEEDVKPNTQQSDEEMEDVEEVKSKKKVLKKSKKDSSDEEEGEGSDSDDDAPKSKKRKRNSGEAANGKSKKGKGKASSAKSKKGKKIDDDGDKSGIQVKIHLQQAVTLNFSIKYLLNFTKSTALAPNVRLCLNSEVPLMVEYNFGPGQIRYYLAPKISDD